MKAVKHLIPIFYMICLIGLIYGCENHYSPKPRGYFRIDLPEKNYIKYDSTLAYTFEYPDYAVVTPDYNSPEEKEWINIEFPTLNASLYLSHKVVASNLNVFIEDTRAMAFKHLSKASAISDSTMEFPENRALGMMYQIDGKGVASPIQFYITDANKHFIRGALYFNFSPNNDSIAPLIQFVKADILHFMETVAFK